MNLAPIGSFDQSNPFDSIRHLDENNNEFWYARELMPLLGYKSWQKFNKVIENALENLETVTEQATHHIIPSDKMVKRPQGGGCKLSDYKLSRLACYHVALSCDSRGNNAVKMAKHYFAVKTREAELNQQKPKTAIELARENVKLAQKNLELLEEMELQKLINELLESENKALAEAVDELFDYSSIIRVAKFNQVSEKSFSWRRLKAVSQKLDLDVKKVPCPRFGYKCLYAHQAWRVAYPSIALPETTTLTIKNQIS